MSVLSRENLQKKYMPWFTDNLKLMMKLWDKPENKFRQTGRSVDWNYYKVVRNLTTGTYHLNKRAYFDFISRSKNNTSL